MKLAFVTGSLSPGRDGVGDYTRTLGAACAARGHEVRLLAVADAEEASEADPGAPTVRRMRREQALGTGEGAARRWLEEFAPDWTSLQFVPYSFEPRGLFGPAIPALTALLRVAPRRHVYFHEVWIGAQRGARLKERAIGALQRWATRRLLRAVSPDRIHTSTEFHRAALARAGAGAELLRMFGSVPRPARPPVPAELPGVGPSALVCGHFGTLHPNWQSDVFLTDFTTLAATLSRPAVLVAAGGMGPGKELFDELSRRWEGRIAFVSTGRNTLERLAGVFARFDFAVSSVPWTILGKSSSAAALREHGIKVVGTHPGDPPRGTETIRDDLASDVGFLPYFRDRTLLARAIERTEPRPGVEATADRFLAALEAAHP